MPDLTKIPVPQYQPNQPYHWEYDNLPLKALADRDVAINNAVNNQDQILNEAAGTQGDLANRLNQSIDQDGNLKKTAIDEAAHNIAKHEDGTAIVSSSDLDYYKETLKYSSVSNPVEFVRMLKAERNKLALLAEEATSLAIEFCTDTSCTASNVVLFDNQKIQIQSSSQIIWEHVSANKVKPVLNISMEFAHRHYYNMEPITSDYINYDVTTVNTAYVEGSLKVYINGVRLSDDVSVFCPPTSNPSTNNWTLNRFTPNHVDGSFVLSNAVTEADTVRVDFDVHL